MTHGVPAPFRFGQLTMAKLRIDIRVQYRILLAVSLAIIGVSIVVLFGLAINQLRATSDVYEARELRALGQYARVAARDCVYRVTQAEGELLAQLDVESEDALVASLSAIESNRYDLGCFAIRGDGRVLYPATGIEERDVPLDTLLVRREELIDKLRDAGTLRIPFAGGGLYPAASCYALMAKEHRGALGFCWSREAVAAWCRDVALQNVPLGYVLELMDLEQNTLHRYPPGVSPLPQGTTLVAVEPFPPDTFPWISVVWPEDPETVRGIVRQQVVYYSIGIGLLVLMLTVGVGILAVGMWRAAELARLKADFAANVSHELRTPLALIRAAGESLDSRHDLAPERAQRYLAIIDRETRRLSDLVTNVMRFTRRDQGLGYEFRERDICAFVRGFVDDYALHARSLGFQIETEIPGGPFLARVDDDALLAALVNLLDNAIKFSPDKQPITISVQRCEGGIEIRVIDGGVGVPPEHRTLIFEDFYRIESDLVKKTRGTGIGLALVREIVSAHGGKVWVDTSPGHGATFVVQLPRVREPRESRGEV